jgi:hypothetical protein
LETDSGFDFDRYGALHPLDQGRRDLPSETDAVSEVEWISLP